MMQQPGNPARDDEPVSSGDARDAGSVVLGGHGRSASDELYARAAVDLYARAAADIELGRPYGWSTEPLPISLTALTDRVTGVTFPEDEGQTFTCGMAADAMRGLRNAYLNGTLSRPEPTYVYTEADVRRMYEQACVPVNEVLADLGLSIEWDANEELIRSTRAEFSGDPHDYDVPLEDGMRWSPPPEGKDTPPCPA